MRLEKIKFAGFKSFADPLTVSFPSNLVGIVGPNGCGKSNIIDAVRWVMGESSAKQLRGESITDVIFNGSRDRKPIGQASIELVFDNTDGTLGGEYAAYNQISIKRMVDREGVSIYSLNGARCRRRDITDVFLGTGLNPRGYSIIEQGMISHVIEAKPDELRAYLEEVAGISKYKERRRETENRIKHTLENLDRITDLREELGKQLSHLKRQANAAERYKVLKEEERLLKAQLIAIRWTGLENDAKNYDLLISKQQTVLESYLAELQSIDTAIEKKRVHLAEQSDQHQAIQARYYQIGGEIARLEQTIQHQKEKHHQLEVDLKETKQAQQEAENSLSADREQITTLQTDIEALHPKLNEAKSIAEQCQIELVQSEEQMSVWQSEWDEFNQLAAEYSKTAQVEQTRIQHLEETQHQASLRLGKIDQEKQFLSVDDLENELNQLSAEVENTKAAFEDRYSALVDMTETVKQRRDDNHRDSQLLDEIRNTLQHARGRFASLEALQQAALGEKNESIKSWLTTQGLSQQPRLAQGLKVQNSWETAVETVLGAYLEAVCVDSIDDVIHHLDTVGNGNLTLVEKPSALTKAIKENAYQVVLSQKIMSENSVAGFLNHIFAAENLNEALAIRKTLNPHESVITKDGIWLGTHWLRVSKDNDAKSGIIQREEELKTLKQKIADDEEKEKALKEKLESGQQLLTELEQQREELQQFITQNKTKHADVAAKHHVQQAHIDQIKQRRERLDLEIEELRSQIELSKTVLIEARERWQSALTVAEQQSLTRDQLLEKRDQIRSLLDHVREKTRHHQNDAHELELTLQSKQTQLSSFEQAIDRTQKQLQLLLEKEKQLSENMGKNDQPVETLEKELNESLELRVGIEQELLMAKQALNHVEHDIQELIKSRQRTDESVQLSRQELENKKLQHQSLTVRQSSLLEQLAETHFELQPLIEAMPEGASEATWNESIEKIAERINRLGPINLAAIEEHQQTAERKEYLDKQHADLDEALNTLQNAIRKIDKETRTKFKDTFDQVNQRFQELFPKVFGGGSARLEMTEEDLLTTGITLYARPPGKRISHIHLLSGGEKALTAISLVFALFHLNPSPFCLLDEVDAPLDDNNVGRFCEMVKEMSQHVQFIFISHNKLAIEMAGHLVGVTMNEPGVSRVVSVDVDAAVAMVAS